MCRLWFSWDRFRGKLIVSVEIWIAIFGLCATVLAAIIGWLNYRHHKVTEPWKLTKLTDELWELERLQTKPVWITFLLNFGGTGVDVMNASTLPGGVFSRGRRVTLRLSPSIPGTQLTVFYRPLARRERRADQQLAPEYGTPEGMYNENWSADVY